MTVAIMQPYFLPYLGYWQLLNFVDIFIVLDDVNFIKKGWINRNNILVNGQSNRITIPLIKVSQHKKICEIDIFNNSNWKEKLKRKVLFSYKSAPNFDAGFDLFNRIIDSNSHNLLIFLKHQLDLICKYFEIDSKIKFSSQYDLNSLKGEYRILELCERNQCTRYINLIGGLGLYNKSTFNRYGIELQFLKTKNNEYHQYSNDFIPNLSILDTIMFNDKEVIKSKYLKSFKLI